MCFLDKKRLKYIYFYFMILCFQIILVRIFGEPDLLKTPSSSQTWGESINDFPIYMITSLFLTLIFYFFDRFSK